MHADSNANRGSHIPDSTASDTASPARSATGLSSVPLMSLAVVVLLLLATRGKAGSTSRV